LSDQNLWIGETEIVDTFAEAFSMRYCRLLVTAINSRWLLAAANEYCGYGSSVIGCDAEAGIEGWVDNSETPDGRPGVQLLTFGFSTEAVAKAALNRVGQCLMTCPTTAVFNGGSDPEFVSGETVPLGAKLRFFGDGFQKSKLIDNRRYWRVPVMDGEFIVEESVTVRKGVAGGNILIQAVDQLTGLTAAENAIEAISDSRGTITPFPGGVVRSGSKVGSRYKALRASTSHGFCPTLRGRVETELRNGVNCVYEIVIDGVDEPAVAKSMQIAIGAAAVPGVVAIGAGNYGGKLGKYHFHLHELLDDGLAPGKHASDRDV
jgi:formylmethanofuran--tetrahydromethanopterin N-formyltransferase